MTKCCTFLQINYSNFVLNASVIQILKQIKFKWASRQLDAEYSLRRLSAKLSFTLYAAPVVKKNNCQAEIYFTFLKKRFRPNLESFPFQVWISVETSAKQLSSETNFITFSKTIHSKQGRSEIKVTERIQDKTFEKKYIFI